MLRTLFLSYDGMTDPLGQSQVLPYLKGLSKDYHVSIISCEKPHNFAKFRTDIESSIKGFNIEWHPLIYHKSPPILSTLWDLSRIKSLAVKLHKASAFSLIHCRSHLLGLIGEQMYFEQKIPYLFDVRSFYPDERVDGNLWPQSNPIYRLIYNYFKRKEREMLRTADEVVVLTEAAKEIVTPMAQRHNVTVIPCCADFELFNFNHVKASAIAEARRTLKIDDQHFVISYLGK